MNALLALLLLAAAGAQAGPDAAPCSILGPDGLTEHSRCLERRGRDLFVKKTLLRRLPFSQGLAPVWNKDLGWMYADRKGKVLIRGVAVMDNGPDGFHDGLVRVERGGRCGYSDLRGKAVVPPAYDGCLNFEDAVARVCLGCRSVCDDDGCEHRSYQGGEWLCVDTAGKRVPCPSGGGS